MSKEKPTPEELVEWARKVKPATPTNGVIPWTPSEFVNLLGEALDKELKKRRFPFLRVSTSVKKYDK